jgi:hypothetical protein
MTQAQPQMRADTGRSSREGPARKEAVLRYKPAALAPTATNMAVTTVANLERGRTARVTVAIAMVIVVAEFVLLALWQRNGYWDYSDGVYAQSAREFLHGLVPYRDFAAAQPPLVYLVGALLLAIHDGLAAVRAGMAVADLATAGLVAMCVWRLTGLRVAAAAAGLLSPLLPITLHEHAQLMPETLAAPLLLGGALLCARVGRAALGGVMLALAAACKLAFVVPALGIALVCRQRRQAAGGFILAGLAFAIVSLAVFGTGVWREAVRAQLQVGHASLHYAGGLIAQGAWSELPLVLPAAAATWLVWTGREHPLEPELMRTLLAAAVAGLALTLTVFKRGSYINVLVVAEPPLLALAVAGTVWWVRRSRAGATLMALLGLLLVAQIASLLVRPANPPIAKRPGAQSGLAYTAGPGTVDRIVAEARRCPRRLAYSADPYYAFLADRRMPGRQPDLFMLVNARIDARFERQAAADEPRCP